MWGDPGQERKVYKVRFWLSIRWKTEMPLSVKGLVYNKVMHVRGQTGWSHWKQLKSNNLSHYAT